MARIARTPIKNNPELIDRVIADLQKGLAAHLPWLNHAFGNAERLVRYEKDKKKIFVPSIFVGDGSGNNDYIELVPNSDLGNFCFFRTNDPEGMEWLPKITGTIETEYSLIFWFDTRKVPAAGNNRNIEAVKAEVLKVLNGAFLMPNGRITVTRIYSQAEGIYAGYTLDEINNNFLMHPYAGFRLSGLLTINESC